MRRRQMLALGLLALPALAGRAAAQPADRAARIGLLLSTAVGDPQSSARVDALRTRLQELGWSDPRRLQIVARDFAGDPERLPAAAAELVAIAPDVIVSVSDPALRALQQRTSTIPIVFTIVADPVGNRLVETLSRPGRNATGFSNAEPVLAGKWLELLEEIAPSIREVAVLKHPESVSTASFGRALEGAASVRGMRLVSFDVRTERDLRAALEAAAGPGRALVVLPNFVTSAHAALITALAARYRLPAVYPFPAFAAVGGLIAYGISGTALFREVAEYVDRILRGANPGELPVQQPKTLELVINLRAAREQGISMPPALLARADEVIE